MPKKTVTGKFEGNTITVENTWFSGAKLSLNNEIIATNNDVFSIKKNEPLMSANVVINEVEHLIEVFVHAIITVKLQIRVNGSHIAGDKF